MKTNSLLGVTVALALLVSCKSENRENTALQQTARESAVASDSKTVANPPAPSAVVETSNPGRKFVRTADVKFKVKDVARSTDAVEGVVTRSGGFVVNTELKSEINDTRKAKMSEDSIVKTTRFTVSNTLVIRVPNANLDATLKAISKEVGYLDHRIIKAEDVALQLKSNELAQKRLARHRHRVADAIDAKGSKLKDITASEQELLGKHEASDTAMLGNLELEDKIAYSTVALELYQDETIAREVLANPDNAAFRTPFGTRALDSLKTGWYILESIVTFLLNFWPFALLVILGYAGYRKFGKRKVAL